MDGLRRVVAMGSVIAGLCGPACAADENGVLVVTLSYQSGSADDAVEVQAEARPGRFARWIVEDGNRLCAVSLLVTPTDEGEFALAATIFRSHDRNTSGAQNQLRLRPGEWLSLGGVATRETRSDGTTEVAESRLAVRIDRRELELTGGANFRRTVASVLRRDAAHIHQPAATGVVLASASRTEPPADPLVLPAGHDPQFRPAGDAPAVLTFVCGIPAQDCELRVSVEAEPEEPFCLAVRTATGRFECAGRLEPDGNGRFRLLRAVRVASSDGSVLRTTVDPLHLVPGKQTGAVYTARDGSDSTEMWMTTRLDPGGIGTQWNNRLGWHEVRLMTDEQVPQTPRWWQHLLPRR